MIPQEFMNRWIKAEEHDEYYSCFTIPLSLNQLDKGFAVSMAISKRDAPTGIIPKAILLLKVESMYWCFKDYIENNYESSLKTIK